MERKTQDQIQAFWKDAAQAEVDAQGLRPTARDPYLQLAIEDIVERYLDPSQQLLDVGCGDGLSTLRFAARAKLALGVDYVEDFVCRSRDNAARREVRNAFFERGDATDLGPIRNQHGKFDIAVSIRCLINLPTQELQDSGLVEIARCLRPGGLFLCSEGWIEGWENLNRLRVQAGMDPIQVVPYNRLIQRADFEKKAARLFEPVAFHSIGLYLFISRVLQPAFLSPEPPSHTHLLNRVGRELQRTLELADRFEEWDFAGVLVFRRNQANV